MRKSYIPKTYSKHQNTRNNHKKSSNILVAFLKILLFLIIIGGLGYILYSPILNIRNIEIKIEDQVSQEDILTKTEASVQDNTYWWYNNKNIFLFRSDKLEQYLLQKFPTMQAVEIKRDILAQSINLNITFRKAIFKICENETCYNISEEGINMGLNAEDPSQDIVIIKGIEAKKPNEMVFSNREINWLTTILQEYNKIDSIKISSIDIQQKSQDSIIRVFVYTDKGYYIMLDLDTDVVYQAEVLKQVFISQIPLEKRSILEYIDLRTKDRVYYKFR